MDYAVAREYITALALLLLLYPYAHCQLPAAPSSTPGSRAIFWSVSFAALSSAGYDSYITNEGLYHSSGGCYEAHGDPYPSAPKLYAKSLAVGGAAVGAGYLITRLPAFRGRPKLAALVGASIPAIFTFKHARGAYRWHIFKDGACLR